MAVGAKSLLSSASHLVTSYIHLHHKLHARPPPHHHLLCRALVVVLLVPHRCKPPHTSARSETTAHGTFSSSSSSTSTTTTKLNTSTHTMAAAAAQFTPEQLALAEVRVLVCAAGVPTDALQPTLSVISAAARGSACGSCLHHCHAGVPAAPHRYKRQRRTVSLRLQ